MTHPARMHAGMLVSSILYSKTTLIDMCCDVTD